MSTLGKILVVVTSHNTLGTTGKPTGYYLSEVSHPFVALVEAGYTVDIASTAGGRAPLDPGSLDLKDADNKLVWETPAHRAKLDQTIKLSDVKASDYRAILYAGGHGTMWDFPKDPGVLRVTGEIYDQGGIVSAVCHGPAALIDVKLKNGQYLVAGKKIAAFSNAEETAAGVDKIVPFALESELRKRGGIYSSAPLWQTHVVVDDRLITGQNPASARAVGQAIVAKLKPKA